MSTEDTLLVLDGIGIPRYSARGLTQTLTFIQQAADLRRGINGDLMDWSHSQFRKYASKISCTDQRAPAIDGVFPGDEVTIHCVCELAYPDGGVAQRSAVPGSERLENGFRYYRPVLNMRVVSINLQDEEYPESVGWDMDLEER